MALSLNSVAGLKSKLQAKFQGIPRTIPGASRQKIDYIAASTGRRFWWGSIIKDNRSCLVISAAADDNKVATDSTNKDSGNAERALSGKQSSPAELLSLDSSPVTIQPKTSAQDRLGLQMPKDSNGLQGPDELKQNTSSPPSVKSAVKRSSLTAREKLRAARVLSQYAASKPSKSELGSKVLDAMREGDRGKKRSGLPEAPENLLDDSKRGLPKSGLTFDFPGGNDLFLIVFSVVFISTLMFGTAYVVWKAGAIHFNEY